MKSVEQHFLYKGKERFRMASNNDSEKPKKQGWHISRDKAISKEGRMREKKMLKRGQEKDWPAFLISACC